MWLKIIILVCIASLSEQLKCYECENTEHQNNEKLYSFQRPCKDFNESLLRTCPNLDDTCVTLRVEKDLSGQSVHLCGSPSRCQASDGSVKYGEKISCTSCETDGCNIASTEFFNINPELDNEDNLRCYVCVDGSRRITKDLKKLDIPSCNGFPDTALQTCPSVSDVCEKIVIKTEDEVSTIRSCGTTERSCDNRDGLKTKKLEINCHSCDTHGCNASSQTTLSRYLSIAIPALLVKKYFFL